MVGSLWALLNFGAYAFGLEPSPDFNEASTVFVICIFCVYLMPSRRVD